MSKIICRERSDSRLEYHFWSGYERWFKYLAAGGIPNNGNSHLVENGLARNFIPDLEKSSHKYKRLILIDYSNKP